MTNNQLSLFWLVITPSSTQARAIKTYQHGIATVELRVAYNAWPVPSDASMMPDMAAIPIEALKKATTYEDALIIMNPRSTYKASEVMPTELFEPGPRAQTLLGDKDK